MGILDGRVAICTGAGRGIGASIAKLMVAEGACVVDNDLGAAVDGSGSAEMPADRCVATIRAAGGSAVSPHGSVTDPVAAEDMVRTTLDPFGELNILVNDAGILRDRVVFNMTLEEWQAVLKVHLTGTFNTTQAAPLHWRATRAGNYRLMNSISGLGLHGSPGQPN